MTNRPVLPNKWDQWKPRRQMKYLGQLPPKQAPTTGSQYPAAFPSPPPAPDPFLPLTPEYEAAQRYATDALSAAEADYTRGVSQVQPWLDLQLGRLGTDRGYAQQSLDEGTAERGIYDSGVRAQLTQRDIAVPYGRAQQDLGLSATQQYADLASQLGSARLGFDQQMMEALLQRAAQVASEMPWSVPQYGYELPESPPTTLQQKPKRRGKRGKNGRK